MKLLTSCIAILVFSFVLLGEAVAVSKKFPHLKQGDACLLASPSGTILVSVNIDTKLVPASILKYLTALVGFHYLGEDYQFPTDVYLNKAGDLTIKGFGDPMFLSETMVIFAEETAAALQGLQDKTRHIHDIILDDTYFQSPLTIPGISDSLEPYDAPNGALSANFNTVAFKRLKSGKYVSDETQTPLVPIVMDRIKASGLRKGRIILSHDNKMTTRYWGELALYFLGLNGIEPKGNMKIGKQSSASGKLLFRFYAPLTLSEVVDSLMAFSNNFIANQILIAAGAKAKSAPGTLDKGVQAAQAYAQKVLHLPPLQIEEGSGISRDNRLSARTIYQILRAFKPYTSLLRKNKKEYYKTGTLNGISTRAGFMRGKNDTLYPFVIMLNDSAPKMKKVRNYLYRHSLK